MVWKPSILLTRRWPAEVETRLQERYSVVLNEPDVPLTRAQLRQAMRDHDALCPTVTDMLDAAILDVESRRVRFIGNYGAGHQHIDVAACRALGIAVSNTPDVLTDATANLAITLMLMTARRASEGERLVRGGRWEGWSPVQLLGHDLDGRMLGLVGFGRIGQAVALKARLAFGMRIGWHGRNPDRPADPRLDAVYFETLDALLAEADIVSLHIPGGEQTRHLIDCRRLALMKPEAILINTARGTVVDESALAEMLRTKRIAGAGLDVYEREPKVDPALLGLENVVLLPHLGSATSDTRRAMGMRVADNLDAFFFGGAPPDLVV
ncbi:MAG TPA: D-glycerate dehydrogenase [Allosphingosinicella sp.]|nr:D-glycerate dehydrogenase [Allosphingosinicella sp.]